MVASNWRKTGVRSVAGAITAGIAAGVLAIYVALIAVYGDPAVGGWFAPLLIVELGCGFVLIILNRRHLPARRVLVGISVLFAAALLLSLAAPFLWMKWAPAVEFDGTNPAATGCTDATAIVDEWQITAPSGEELAVVRQMYSNTCRTTWLRVLTSDSDLSTSKTIGRGAGDWLWAFTTETVTDPATEQWTFGDQIVAPGCVAISVQVLDTTAAIVGELNRTCP